MLGTFTLWAFIIALAGITVYMPYTSVHSKWEPTPRVLYGAFFRFAWSLSVALVVYACQRGMGGLINEFLSWGFFIPLSRLTYATYLIHLMLVKLYYASMRKPVYMTEVLLIYLYVGMCVLSYVTAYLFAVLVEYPTRHVIQYSVQRFTETVRARRRRRNEEPTPEQ